jgi:DedD protein
MDSANLRNIDQIQEGDPGKGPGTRLGTLIMASLAGACVVFAVFALAKKPGTAAVAKADPLADLAQKAASAPSANPALAGHDVAFPSLLSDDPKPTTAMAAIRKGNDPIASSSGQLVLPPGAPTEPPPAADQLPVVPLPAQNYLSLSPVVTRPRDSLTAMAQHASTPTGAEAERGGPGQFQLQVSSFRKESVAEKFASALRQRGHRAYVESADVPGKGTWYRVRVGPFKNKYEAMNYRAEFEKREHIVTFLVEPPRPAMTARRPIVAD